MPSLFVESDANERGPFVFRQDPTDLLALLSFGLAEPFGSQHALTELVRRLKRVHGIDPTPLLTFYDRDVEDAVDQANLDAAWQNAVGLRDCLRAVRRAIAADPEAERYLAGFPAVPDLLLELERMAEWTAARTARIRISFSMR